MSFASEFPRSGTKIEIASRCGGILRIAEHVDELQRAGVELDALGDMTSLDHDAPRGARQPIGGVNDIGAVGQRHGRARLVELGDELVGAVGLDSLLEDPPDETAAYGLRIGAAQRRAELERGEPLCIGRHAGRFRAGAGRIDLGATAARDGGVGQGRERQNGGEHPAAAERLSRHGSLYGSDHGLLSIMARRTPG